ncbi:MAG: Glycine cleavage system protein [Planctomycetota bacterium]|jgi:aminomethyltransferase
MKITPLNSWHRANHGRMVEFGGWEMPVQYSSIVEEHLTVRRAAGLFDISHMGRLILSGETAGDFLNRTLTNDVSQLRPGDVRYSLICQHDGGILDDVLVYRLQDRWELVVNASNRLPIISWLEHLAGFASISFHDQTESTGMIALQGPAALKIIQALGVNDANSMARYSARDVSVEHFSGLISRTGYTGEDGFELIVAADQTERLWSHLLALGAPEGILPAGLGCRDTLRLEAAMPLYGHELNTTIDPLTAGLSFGVRFEKPEYPGKAALELIRETGPTHTRVGLALEGRRIAREGSPVFIDGNECGTVTSGTFSPTLQQVIAMAYVPTDVAIPGRAIEVELRGTMLPGQIVELPFYKRPRS